MSQSRSGTPSSGCARGGLDEARQQVHQRALAGARGADQRHRLAGAHLQRQRLQRRLGVVAVAQAHVAQAISPRARPGAWRAACLDRALLDEVDAAFHRGQAARDGRHHVRQVLDRRATSSSMAVMKATKLPTDEPPLPACHSATAMTADSAKAASICVTGVMVAPATTAFSSSRRSAALVEEAPGLLPGLRAVQAHDAPGQHVLFHHVGQLVGGPWPCTVSLCSRRPRCASPPPAPGTAGRRRA
jgi:hypothetical protein